MKSDIMHDKYVVKKVKYTRILGVIIDDRLTFKTHAKITIDRTKNFCWLYAN